MITDKTIEENLKQLNHKMDILINQMAPVQKIDGQRYVITYTEFNQNYFFWVTNSDAEDIISKEAQCGRIFLDSAIYSIFHKENGTFIDLGANIGAFSLPFAAAGWKGYAFEAGTPNVTVLNKSIALNDFNVKVVDKVVYDKSGKMYFVSDGPWGFVKNNVYEDEQYEEMDAISLDDWFASNSVDKVDLIKMDIEGSEVAALRGMRQMLKNLNYPPIYTEVNTFALALQGESQYSYFSEAESMGYRIFEIYDGNLYEYSRDIFPINFCRDYVFIKEVPKDINCNVYGRIANNDGRQEQVIKRLRNYEQWANMDRYGREDNEYDYDAYICFALKDYPDFITGEMKELLNSIKKTKKDNLIIQKFLAWL